MPQLLVLGLVGAGLYAGYRWLTLNVQNTVASDRERAERARVPRDLGALEWDDESGVYRPAKR